MKNKISDPIPYPYFLIPLFSLNLLAVVVYFFIRNHLPPQVPLLYGLPYGEEQLVRKDLIIAPLVAAIFIIAINGILVKINKDDFIQKVLLYLIVATTLLGLVTVTKIVLLVGSF